MKCLMRAALLGSLIAVTPMYSVGAAPSRHETSTGGLRITAVAKGDCAQNATTILVTDATTSCSIEISITPARRYVDVAVFKPLGGKKATFPKFHVSKDGSVKVSARGRGSVRVSKTYGLSDGRQCVISEGTERVFVQVTNAKAPFGSVTAVAKSKPISVTFKQTVGMDECSVSASG